jgi:hypothetical protein
LSSFAYILIEVFVLLLLVFVEPGLKMMMMMMMIMGHKCERRTIWGEPAGRGGKKEY